MAVLTRSIAFALSASPNLTEDSMRASFALKSEVWVLRAFSMAASFSATEVLMELIAAIVFPINSSYLMTPLS